MIIETILLVGGAFFFAGDRCSTLDQKKIYGHINSKWYGITRAWWKGAFHPDTPATSIAAMIDSDLNCELWKFNQYGDWLSSESLGVRACASSYEKCKLQIKRDDDTYIKVDISDYDDYILRTAISSFEKRKRELAQYKKEQEVGTLIDSRITKNYIDTIEMIERRILHKEPEEFDLLRTLLDGPKKPELTGVAHIDDSNNTQYNLEKKKEEELRAKYDQVYGDPVCQKYDAKREYKKNVESRQKRRKEVKYDYF